MREYNLFTSESVSEGHPDKMADQISDAILDAILREDLHARVACETLVKTGAVIVYIWHPYLKVSFIKISHRIMAACHTIS